MLNILDVLIMLRKTSDDKNFLGKIHWVKSVRIRSYSGPRFSRIFPHSNWIRKNADQNNYEYGLFSRSDVLDMLI